MLIKLERIPLFHTNGSCCVTERLNVFMTYIALVRKSTSFSEPFCLLM